MTKIEIVGTCSKSNLSPERTMVLYGVTGALLTSTKLLIALR